MLAAQLHSPDGIMTLKLAELDLTRLNKGLIRLEAQAQLPVRVLTTRKHFVRVGNENRELVTTLGFSHSFEISVQHNGQLVWLAMR